MSNKSIKLKLTLNSIGEYNGGSEALLNDIKNSGIIIHRDIDKFYITSECEGKYNAYTEDVSKLNELNLLAVYDISNNEIARLKIDFLELDDSLYKIPDGSTFEETELIIGFLESQTYTILFTNLMHPEFDVDFPDSITVDYGESVLLPSVSGSFDEDGYKYTPLEWSIGSFGESFTPTENVTANLIWKAEEINFNLKVYGQYGGTIYLGDENNFVYVFDEPNNRYIMLEGGTSSTTWEIVSIIDTNGNEVSKESDYIWWINKNNIYYKASPTRPVSAAYILLKTTPPIS